ncbi:ribosomal protein L37AE/L43A [Paeniglutamicibacter psychrophenolicus]|uniref:Ribosomal protein L37AE/L43A n=1 Tax=Paeniglutamicibacter psychrophenolicus TaxID=257454 RepID=A0ABS4WLN0_9MICC|nr:ribosomal protein L37AE/L43A [Paeniglutamicibacter psychrophenolicus]
MTIKPNAQSNQYSMLDCPHCDKAGPHFFIHERRKTGIVFQCEQCLAMFTDPSMA